MEAAEELWRERPKEQAHLRAESTGDKVESGAEWRQDALSYAHDATARNIMIYAHSKR